MSINIITEELEALVAGSSSKETVISDYARALQAQKNIADAVKAAKQKVLETYPASRIPDFAMTFTVNEGERRFLVNVKTGSRMTVDKKKLSDRIAVSGKPALVDVAATIDRKKYDLAPQALKDEVADCVSFDAGTVTVEIEEM